MNFPDSKSSEWKKNFNCVRITTYNTIAKDYVT